MMDEQRFREEAGMLGYNIVRTTHHLFAVLRGLEFVRDEQTALYAQLTPEVLNSDTRISLNPSYLDGHPSILGDHPLDELTRDGAVEQFAYRAWVVEIFSLWEHEHRPQSKRAVGAAGIYPQLNVMNDLRHIRNDLLHAHGMATKEHCGKCEVLRWFQPGEPMTFRMSHVLDFVHQMGCLGFGFTETTSGYRSYSWGNNSRNQLRSRRPAPKIISLRTQPIVHHNTNELWAGVSVVYDNAFHAQIARPARRKYSDQAFSQLRSRLALMRITENGDLVGPDPWMGMSGRNSYLAAIDEQERRTRGEEPSTDFPQEGFHGPWIKFASHEQPAGESDDRDTRGSSNLS